MEENMDMEKEDALDEGMGDSVPVEGADAGSEGRVCASCGHSHDQGDACDCGCSE